MAIEDLDLEFEDEEEQSRGDALDVDVDLSFSAFPIDQKLEKASAQGNLPKKRPVPKAVPNRAPQSKPSPSAASPAAQARSPQQAAPQTQAQPQAKSPNNVASARTSDQSTQNVRSINESKNKANLSSQAKPVSQVQPDYTNHSHQDIAELREEIEQLRSQINHIEHQADIKVAVAEAERDYLVEYVSNAKLLDHQVTQVLSRMNKKVPALAPEVQLVKKYVSEFLQKAGPKRKKED